MNSLRVPSPTRCLRSREVGFAFFAVLPALLLSFALVGCSGVPAPTACYQITAATVHSVDKGMTVAGDLYRAGLISDAQKEKLIAAHDVYRPAAQAAVAGCKAVQAQGDIDAVVARMKEAADKLIEALVAAGVVR